MRWYGYLFVLFILLSALATAFFVVNWWIGSLLPSGYSGSGVAPSIGGYGGFSSGSGSDGFWFDNSHVPPVSPPAPQWVPFTPDFTGNVTVGGSLP